jgi:hypothetical protein
VVLFLLILFSGFEIFHFISGVISAFIEVIQQQRVKPIMWSEICRALESACRSISTGGPS